MNLFLKNGILLKESVKSGFDETETVVNVISAFEVPRFEYNTERKKFFKDDALDQSIFSNASSKANLYRLRYIFYFKILEVIWIFFIKN